MRFLRALGVLSGFGVLAGAAGCLLTSDFGGIVGRRPDGLDGGVIEEAGDAGVAPCGDGEHVFCTDFDQGDTLPVPGWTSSQSGGTLAIDVADPRSPPNALVARVKGETSASAYLLRDAFIGTYTAAKLSFDFKIIDCEAQLKNSLTFVYVGVGTDVAYGFAILSAGSLAMGSLVKGQQDFFALEKPVPKGEWRRLVLTLTPVSTSVMHINLTVDGERAVDTDALSGAGKSTFTLNLGIQGATAPLGCQVAFDNVAMDKE